MYVRKTDKAIKLLRLIASQIVTVEQFNEMVERSEPYKPKKDLLNLSLGKYAEFLNEIESSEVEGLLFLLRELEGIKNPRKAINKMTAERFLAWTKYLKTSIERVQSHFDSIPKIPRSERVKKATAQVFDFGVYRIVDMLACRQGITDAEAEEIPLIVAITKMKIDAENELIRWRVEQALLEESRSKSKKRQ